MKCQLCGHDNPLGVKFCSKCGGGLAAVQPDQGVPHTTQPVAPYAPPQGGQHAQGQGAQYAPAAQGKTGGLLDSIKALPLKKILMIAIPVVVVIIAAIIVIPLLVGPSSNTVSDSLIFFSDRDQVIVSGNNNNSFTLDGAYRSVQRSIDGSKAAVLTDYQSDSGGTLWFVTTRNSVKIADDVLAFVLADSGNGVAFLTDHDTRNDVATLYLHNTSNGRSTLITQEAMYFGHGEIEGIAISPNGRTVTFISDFDERDNEFFGYIKDGNRAPERLGRNEFAIAVSNGGRHLYYVRVTEDGDMSLHVRSGRNEQRLIGDMGWGIRLMLNRDYSQVIFNHDGRANISRNGGERERIGNQAIRSILVPQGTQVRSVPGNAVSTTVYGLRSLTPSVVVTEDGLVHVNNRMETNRVSSSSDYPFSAVISNNGRTLLFINNNNHLSTIDPTRPGAERREVGRNVRSFVACSDARTVYFVNEDQELFHVRGTGNPSKVSDDVASFSLEMQWGSRRAFFIVDHGSRGGELFASNNGGRRSRVAGGDDVVGIMVTATSVFYANNDDEVFRSNGNERFTRFEEDVGIVG